ncbi:hypothetical protein [Neorhizobium vignae]|uniref:hypothetical protein n=1 Tax=Neorhizobium vignae TaxID=690585 RepID=UPI0005645D0D|nr:hypothetical protein [Neorhizobium vignae]
MRKFVISLLLIALYSLSPLLIAFFAEGIAYASGCRPEFRSGAICPPEVSLVYPFEAALLASLHQFSLYLPATILTGAILFVVWLVALMRNAIIASKHLRGDTDEAGR